MVAEPENFIEQVAKSNTVDEASGMSTVVNYRCVIYFSSPDLLFSFLFFPFFAPLEYIARSSATTCTLPRNHENPTYILLLLWRGSQAKR